MPVDGFRVKAKAQAGPWGDDSAPPGGSTKHPLPVPGGGRGVPAQQPPSDPRSTWWPSFPHPLQTPGSPQRAVLSSPGQSSVHQEPGMPVMSSARCMGMDAHQADLPWLPTGTSVSDNT